jgi:hypothetical protein
MNTLITFFGYFITSLPQEFFFEETLYSRQAL